MSNFNPLSGAIRFALFAGAAAMLAGPAFAQEEAASEEDVATLDRIEVTGSLIKKAEIEGPLPITVITAEDIRAEGEMTVADVLRQSTFNSFGSLTPSSGAAGGGQNQSLVSLRGLGSNRTLILVDGRRIAYSPGLTVNAQNLNNIPAAAVERIEILTDGASAIYGSDAIGGVVNVILRKDFEGMQMSGGVTFPSGDAGDETNFSFLVGTASDRSNLMVSYEAYERSIINYRDRDYLVPDVSTPEAALNAFNNGQLSPTGFPPSYIGLNDFIVRAADNCPTSFGGPDFPNSGLVVDEFGDAYCTYNFSNVAGYTASLSRDTLSASGNYQINDNVNAFFRMTNSRSKSFGVFAPTPASFIMDELNPFNPTFGTPEQQDIQVLVRLTPGGNRDSYLYDYDQAYTFGLNGTADFFGGADWEVGVSTNRYKQDSFGYNYVNTLILSQLAATANPFTLDGLTALNREVAQTITVDNLYRSHAIDGRIGFDVWEMGGGTAALALATEYRTETYLTQSDQQALAGNVAGTAGGNAGGNRDSYAFGFELYMPIAESFEASIAGRYDSYNQGLGGDFNPKVSLGWRPIEEILVRGSWGTGFRAPDLNALFAIRNQSFLAATDTLRCETVGVCQNRQRETYRNGNLDLGPEESDQWSVGIVFSPTEALSFSLDYSAIDLEGGIRTLSTQEVLDAEYLCFTGETEFCDAGRWGSVDRTIPAAPIVTRVAINDANIESRSVDFRASYDLDTASIGEFRFTLAATKYLDYKTGSAISGGGLSENIGTFDAPSVLSNFAVQWNKGDFSAGANLNYIGSFNDCPGLASCGDEIGSLTTADVNIGWKAPWDGEFILGVRNVTDEEPELSTWLGDIPTTHTQALYGRVPYFNYTQKF
jgi:iron complex outermembrane receptor protein